MPPLLDIVEADEPLMLDTPQPDDLPDTSGPSEAIQNYGDEPPTFVERGCELNQHTMSVELPDSTMINPRSSATNFVPPLPVADEFHAIKALLPLASLASLGPDEECTSGYVYIDLDEFEVYNDTSNTKGQLRSLHLLATNNAGSDLSMHGTSRMFFNGILSVGTARFYVERIPFKEAPVDHYGVEYDTVKGHISIRSELNEDKAIYYRLGRPSTVYKRFYEPYLWVADLGKHFIDFVDSAIDRDRDVRVSHFRLQFAKWLHKTHGKSTTVREWRNAYGAGRNDFAPAVVAHSAYLMKEISSLMEERVVSGLGFFREIGSTFYKTHNPRIPENHPVDAHGQPKKPLPTVVTPYMHHMFKDLAIGEYLQSTPGEHAPATIDERNILPQHHMPFTTGTSSTSPQDIGNIQPGDVISTLPDDTTTDSKWAASAEKSAYWYALVHQVVEPPPRSRLGRSFHVVWLYRPEHTPCGAMRYPWSNELFMCDHCTCSEANDQSTGNILESEVTGVHSVEWFGGPNTKADFFIRQTYLHGDRSWVQLQLGHIFCQDSVDEATRTGSAFASHFGTKEAVHSIGFFDKPPVYLVGDTVLATRSRRNQRSEPFEIVSLPSPENGVLLRRLLRRNEVDPDTPNAPPNELVYTDEIVELSKNGRIFGRCVVRVFTETKKIPVPYNRGGAGNIFYMTHQMDKKSGTVGSDIPALPSSTDYDIQFVPLDAAKDAPNLRQGFDPSTPVPRLRAMELFCGCGNLGRGIEDAGATETRCANDIWPGAMHTFMANVASPDRVQPFIGSADTLLERAICWSPSALQQSGIPVPGEIDFISGGSPCQGFSNLTRNKSSEQQYKNRSMVASFASFIDLYRPKFGLLENVPAIVKSSKHKSASTKADIAHIREDIFGQLICSLLGVGYQLRIMLLNAWMYGAPQRRQRVFLIFSAPGYQLPYIPLPSHGSPPDLGAGSQRTIGRLATGEWITGAGYQDVPTAFPFVSAGDATADLAGDNIYDGVVDICVRHPDHRIVPGGTTRMRAQMAAIPMQPYGMGLMYARNLPYFKHMLESAGTFNGKPLFSQRELGLKTTRAFMRTNPTRLFQTVRTSCAVSDALSGGDLHWSEPRPLTVLEVRRAQGLPDDDVLLGGTKVSQWKMVGNAVARQIALALGLSLREAWLGTLCEDRRQTKENADMPWTTTTTTATTTVVTPTTSTTTATTGMAHGSGSDDVLYKQNRIFQTSVYKESTSTVVLVPDLPIAADSHATLKRPRSLSSPQAVTDDIVLAKRQRWTDSNASGSMHSGQ